MEHGAHKTSRYFRLTKDRLPGIAKRNISPFLSQDDWKAVCPKADRQQSTAEKQPHSTMFYYLLVHFSCILRHGISGLGEKGIYGWGEAAGVLEVEVAKVFLLVYSGKERRRMQKLAHEAMLI